MRSHFFCLSSELEIVLAEMAEFGKILRCALQRIIAKAAAWLLFRAQTASVPVRIITKGAIRFNFISEKPLFPEHESIPRSVFYEMSATKTLYHFVSSISSFSWGMENNRATQRRARAAAAGMEPEAAPTMGPLKVVKVSVHGG